MWPPPSPHLSPRITSPELRQAGWWFLLSETRWRKASEFPSDVKLWVVGVQLKSPWVASGSAYRRDRPERSHPAVVAPRLLWAGLGSAYKKRPCPCSVASCGSRTGRPLPDAAPGGSSAGCGRWCSVVEHQLVRFDLLLKETNTLSCAPLHSSVWETRFILQFCRCIKGPLLCSLCSDSSGATLYD